MTQRRTAADIAPVMVGVDGSRASLAAVELGAWEAKRRRVPLALVHSLLEPLHAYGWLPHGAIATAVRDDARRMLTDVELRTRAGHPGLTVRATLVAGGAASTLVELSRLAGLVVVGSRGTGGFAGLPIGSVGTQVATHAHAPVIVVRSEIHGSGPVLVGVDGSPEGAAALGFAFDEASARGVQLTALYAWWSLPSRNLGPTSHLHFDLGQAREEAQRLLAEAVAGWSDKYPDVVVHRLAAHDMDPAVALVEASARAGLLVVGTRGRGGFARMVLGSVSSAVLTHAHCPVAIVRDRI